MNTKAQAASGGGYDQGNPYPYLETLNERQKTGMFLADANRERVQTK